MDGHVLGHWFGTRQRRSPSVDTRMAVELCPGGHSNDTVANGGARRVGAYFCGAPCDGVGSRR